MNVWSYVYKLTHKVTGQFYIGYRGANKLPAAEDLPKYRSSSQKVKEMGFDNFNWEILAEFQTPEEAYGHENRLIAESFDSPLCLNGHYRLANNGKRFRSDTAGPKISAKQTGRKLSEETKRKIRDYWDDEVREKQRLNRLGRKDSEEAKKRKSEWQLGRTMPQETREKLSKAKQGRKNPRSEEGRRAIAEGSKKTGHCPHCDRYVTLNNLSR